MVGPVALLCLSLTQPGVVKSDLTGIFLNRYRDMEAAHTEPDCGAMDVIRVNQILGKWTEANTEGQQTKSSKRFCILLSTKTATAT